MAKIAQEVGWEVVWDAALSRGGQSTRRLQLLVKTLCHNCTDDPLACYLTVIHNYGVAIAVCCHSFQLISICTSAAFVEISCCITNHKHYIEIHHMTKGFINGSGIKFST